MAREVIGSLACQNSSVVMGRRIQKLLCMGGKASVPESLPGWSTFSSGDKVFMAENGFLKVCRF